MQREKIGYKLRELRGKRQREEVAVAIGVTAQAIANYEAGVRIPSDDIKVKLADYYGRTVQEIFFDTKVNTL